MLSSSLRSIARGLLGVAGIVLVAGCTCDDKFPEQHPTCEERCDESYKECMSRIPRRKKNPFTGKVVNEEAIREYKENCEDKRDSCDWDCLWQCG